MRLVYGHPRDKQGHLIEVPDEAALEPYEEQFRAVWRCRGLSEWRIEAKWREHLASQERMSIYAG